MANTPIDPKVVERFQQMVALSSGLQRLLAAGTPP
jgi:hypothetical protein